MSSWWSLMVWQSNYPFGRLFFPLNWSMPLIPISICKRELGESQDMTLDDNPPTSRSNSKPKVQKTRKSKWNRRQDNDEKSYLSIILPTIFILIWEGKKQPSCLLGHDGSIHKSFLMTFNHIGITTAGHLFGWDYLTV